MSPVPPGVPPPTAAPPPVVHLPPAPVAAPALTTATALGLAVATTAGALVARPLPLLLPVAVVALALLRRAPVLLLLAAALTASELGARAVAGLEPPAPARTAAEATLVSDPEVRWGRVEVVARVQGRHVLLRADGAAGEMVAVRLAGERVRVEGRLGPLGPRQGWLRVRHVSARLDVAEARPGAEAAPPWRVANRLRRTLADGVAHLGDERSSLFAGLVLGDDRRQGPEITDDFRGSGLAHLLAVSGQNVVFVVALAAPVLRRLRPGPRLVSVGVVLAGFAVVTRCEPSVLRAVAMAGAAAVAAATGRPTPGLHLLGLAIAGLVLVDPLLVRSVAFQLSVAATAGILVLGPRLAAVLPGPPALTTPVAVTAAAQLGVAPLLVSRFDGVPVSSLPANLLAAPAAGLVMTWGLPAGAVAGLVGGPVATAAHAPTAVALDWLRAVARGAASVPLGELGVPHLAVLAGATGTALAAGRWPRAGRPVRAAAAVAVVAALVAPGVALAHPPPVARPAPGVEVWRAGGAAVVVVEPGTGPVAVLEGLRRAGVTRVDVLVVGPGATAVDEERAARHRARVARVLRRPDARGGDEGGPLVVGDLQVSPTGRVACVAADGASGCGR